MRMTVRQPLASYPDPTRAVSAWQLLQWASTSSLPLSADALFWAQAGSTPQSRAADAKDTSDFFDMIPPLKDPIRLGACCLGRANRVSRSGLLVLAAMKVLRS